jgi:polyhydroxyalkanoate synthase
MTNVPPDPFAGWSALVKGIGGLEDSDRIRRGMMIHATVPRPPVGRTPHTVIHQQNKLEVRFYAPNPAAATGVPVVVIPSLINKAYIVDLEPDRSLVAGLADRGHPVYLIDWGEFGPEDGDTTVADVILDLLHRAVDRICRHAQAPSAFLLGYCQGGTIAAIYAALRPRRVRGLAVFNAPVLFAEGGRFRAFTDPSTFDVDEAMPGNALVPIEVMQIGFKMLDPVGSVTKFGAIEQAARDPIQLARTMARERWLEENVPLPAPFAREFIRRTYQEDALLAGTWELAGERIDLRNITCPVLVTAAQRDFIAPPASVMPLAEATGSDDVTSEVLRTGHIGVVVGSFGPRVFYPMLDTWFRARLPDSSAPEAR